MFLGRNGNEPDAIDRQLIAALQEDAKMPLSRLGERVGLSAPAVMERVRKLEQAGIITGYHAMVDARGVGLDVAAFIGVSVGCPEDLEAFERWVEAEPRVLECHHVTGAHALLLKVKTRDTGQLEDLISAIRSLETVERTETMVVLSTATERVQLPLAPDAEEETRSADRRARKGRRGKAVEVA